MKQVYVGIGIVVSVLVIANFDVVLVFLLSGTIPQTSIALSGSTMVAVAIASLVTLLALKRRRHVVQFAESLYDTLFGKKKTKQSPKTTAHLPKRRFGKI